MPRNANQSKSSNYSLNFDGSNYISITDDPLKDGATNFTLSAWVKADGTVGGSDISFLQNWVSPHVFIIRYKDNGNFQLYLNGAVKRIDVALSSLGLVNNNWNHIVLVNEYDNSQIKVYVNGTLQHTETSTQVAYPSNSTPLKIGGDYNYWDGQIDGVAVFDYALSQSQVTTLYGSSSTGIGNPMSLSPKPVAYYPLGDQDAFNGAEYLVPNSSLKDYVFNQNGNQLVTITGNSTTQPTGDYSLSIWVKVVGSGSYSGILNATSSENANGVSFFYNYSTGNFQFYQSAYANDLIFTGSTNTWQNIIISYNNTTGDLVAYLNGQQADSNTITPSAVNWVVDWQLNNYRQTASPLYGQNEFSNFQIFNTALSSTDAETLYNNGSPLTSMSGYTSLQGWWKLDASATYDSSTTTWTIPDDSTNSNDGTSSGMTQSALQQSDLSFKTSYSPYALDFDGANDYIRISPINGDFAGGIVLPDNFTVSYWIKTNVNINHTGVINGQVNSDGILSFFRFATIRNGKQNLYINNSYTPVTPIINNGDWYNIIYCNSYDNTELKVYTNNSLTYENTTHNFGRGNNIANIAKSEFGLYCPMQLSNLSIWNTALTSSQVSEIYSEGIPQNLLNHSAASSLINWWQLGSNSSFSTYWTVLDEKGSNNGTSLNMTEVDIVDGVGSYANGSSTGMSEGSLVGDAPYSTGNALSTNMAVQAFDSETPPNVISGRSEDVPS